MRKTNDISDYRFELPKGHENRFEQKLATRFGKSRNKIPFGKIAAVLIPLLLISGYFLLNPIMGQKDILAIYSPKLSEAEFYMNYQINLKKERLQYLKNEENHIVVENSLEELSKLRQDYQLLLQDFEKSNGNDQLKIHILSNLEIQIEILEKSLQKIDQINHYKLENHENLL